MYNVLVSTDSNLKRDEVMARLKDLGVETRTYFYPLHAQPVLQTYGTYDAAEFSVSIDLSQRGFYLPSGLAITDHQIDQVCTAVKQVWST
jgi:perosamine synthetase